MKSISSGVTQDEAPESAQILKESMSKKISNVSLDQYSSVNLIKGIDWFLGVVLSLDESLFRFFKKLIVCWDELSDFFFIDRISFYISSTNLGEVVVFY